MLKIGAAFSMLKRIEIDSYMDGYNFSQIDCFNIPIAAITGFFNYNNYFYYCFYITVLLNWGDKKNKDFIDGRNEILGKLGIKMTEHKIVHDSELIPFIKNSIDKSIPLFLISDYTSLFYTSAYLRDDSSKHGIIISGYDSNKQIIAFNETKTVDLQIHTETKKYFNGNPLFIMLLKEEQVIEIWNTRNKHFEESSKEMINIIYSFEKYKEAEINCYEEMVYDFIKIYKPENDNLIDFLNDFSNIREKIKNGTTPMWALQRDLYGSLEAFFGGIEIGLKNAGFKGELNDFNMFKEQYRNKRTKILSRLHAYALREKDINIEMREGMIVEIKIKNKELENFVQYWYEIIKQNNKLKLEQNTGLVNYALGVQAWADSEYKNGTIHCKASQAVDGKWSNWRNDMWHSDNFEEAHWLKIDLVRPRSITRFVIRHDGDKNKVTVDFEIHGSNDDISWNVLVGVQGNKEVITTHKVTSCSYRYFKLNIKKPGEHDDYARIYEFEVWGIKNENE